MQATPSVTFAQTIGDLAAVADMTTSKRYNNYDESAKRTKYWAVLAQLLEPHIGQVNAISCELLAQLRTFGGRALPINLQGLYSGSESGSYVELLAATETLMEDVAALEVQLRNGEEISRPPRSIGMLQLLVGGHAIGAGMFCMVYGAMSHDVGTVEYILRESWAGFMRHSRMDKTHTRGVAIVYACWRANSCLSRQNDSRRASQFLAMALAQLALIHNDTGGPKLMGEFISTQAKRLEVLMSAA